jgi:SAM-dependent methyltransferase
MQSIEQSDLNRNAWSSRASQRDLDGIGGYTDDGERAVLEYVRERARGKPILDIGVGTGRTIPMLEPLASDYRALDFVPSMVEVCRTRYPGVRIDFGDARTLDGFPTDHFGLVSFSFAGIDAVAPADRRRVLRAVRRVLAPGGTFVFSTLNLLGPSFRERPWKIRVWPTRNPVVAARQVIARVAAAPLDLVHWLRIRDAGERGDGYAIAPLSAHHYALLVHYTTLERELRELFDEGFAGEVVFGNRSVRPLSVESDVSHVDWFHVVARRVDEHGGGPGSRS